MDSVLLLDCAVQCRSPATLARFHQGQPPRNKGLRYPPDPPTVEEIIAVMRAAGDRPDGVRLRSVIVVLWRAGLRITEALALQESDLDRTRGAVVAHDPRHAPGWRALLRASRTNTRPAGLALWDPGAVAQCRPRSRGPSPICASSAATRARRGDVP